jgi:hypothetical protein
MPDHVVGFARELNALVRGTVRADLGAVSQLAPLLPGAPWRRRVVRADDLLALDFVFHNLRLIDGKPPRLVRQRAGSSATVVMEIQGQHFGEEVLETTDPPPAAPRVMRARFAFPSRVAARMPSTETSLDLTLEALLDAITRWPASLDALARPPAWHAGLGDLGVAVLSSAALFSLRESLQPIVATLHDALRERGAAAATVAASAIRRADRAAMVATEALRHGRSTDETRSAATNLRTLLSRDRDLDSETRDLTNALFELRLAEAITAAAPTLERGGVIAHDLVLVTPVFELLLRPHPPAETVTSLELPYRVFQSPHASTTFVHAYAPFARAGRTELWRTMLARRTDAGPQPLGPTGVGVTAMWSPDYTGDQTTVPPDPFRMSLTARNRDAIVRVMSGHQEFVDAQRRRRYVPRPATVRRLELSAWGGVLDLDGAWPTPPHGVGLVAWSHDAPYGRDQRVRVVEAGFLYPYGHAAALVTLTERKVGAYAPAGTAAFLRQRRFIVLREPERRFPAAGQAHQGRKLPFTTLTCLTRQTPDLRPTAFEAVVKLPNSSDADAFWPIVQGTTTPARFEFEALDLAGRPIVFTSPAIFVSKVFVDLLATQLHQVHAAWNGPAASPNARARVATDGQTVRMAPVDGGRSGDVDVPLDAVVFEATDASGRIPPYHPAIRAADAHLKALEAVTGRRATQRVQYESNRYLAQGYANNAWRVFLQLQTPYEVRMGSDVPTDRVGGIGQPTQALSAISNGSGAVSGSVAALTSGSVQPSDMFPEAKILGGFDLKDLIAPFVVAGAGAIPGFTTEEFPDKIVTSWRFEDDDVTSPIPGLKTGAGGAKSALELSAKLTAHFTYPSDLGFVNKDGDPAPSFGATTDPGWKDPEAEAKGKLTNFKLNFFGFVIVWFDEFSFTSTIKKKFDPNPKLHDTDSVVFGGPLEFVNRLSDLIPAGGFSDPPIVKPSLTGLEVGYDVGLPSVDVGMFALKNMRVGATLRIPFTGDPVALRFFFCTRSSPFLLKVSFFGGGGFFALVTTAEGIQEVEAAFEFGAYASFSAGVASGGVYVKAGVYFHWRVDAVELEGYVEMGGELSVAGIISVSITLHLSLGYAKQGGASLVKGQATLTIEVSLLFFSVSVKATIERKFAGSSADPTFAQLVTDEATWSRYCAAFA